MIQQMGRLFQQVFTTIVFGGAALVLAVAGAAACSGIIPAFLGETHFAFLGYAKNFRQTPARRQMDYLRQVGGSKEGAKELKLFNLSDYLTNRFAELSQAIYEENVASRARSCWPAACSASSVRWATTAPMPSSSGGRSTGVLQHRRLYFSPMRSCRPFAIFSRCSLPLRALRTRLSSLPICWLSSR